MGAHSRPDDDPGFPTEDPDAQQPQSMDDQVSGQVAINEMVAPIRAMFGGSDGKAIETQAAGGAGGYFKLSPDEISHYEGGFQDVIDRAKDLQVKIRLAHRKLYAPADNSPSHAQIDGARKSLEAAEKHLAGIIAYGKNYHDKLARSVHDYDHVDQANAEQVKKSAGDDSGRAV